MDADNAPDSALCASVSDEDVEPDDIRSDASVDGLSPAIVSTSCLNSADFLSMQRENWVTSVTALRNTDLVVSGKTFCCISVASHQYTFENCWSRRDALPVTQTIASAHQMLFRHC